MDTPQNDPEQLMALCAAECERVRSRYGWRLLAQDEHARLMLERLHEGAAADLRHAAFSTYSEAVYLACSGREGPERQELAYAELQRYLAGAARSRYPDAGAEIAQQALGAVYMDFANCRQPRAFFAFALQRLANAARAVRRQPAGPTLSLDAVSSADGGRPEVPEPASPGPEPVSLLISSEHRQRLLELIAHFSRQHPRARQQLDALLLKFFHGLDDRTISRMLKKPVASIYVLRSRAIARLRNDAAWRLLAAEMGILGAGEAGAAPL